MMYKVFSIISFLVCAFSAVCQSNGIHTVVTGNVFNLSNKTIELVLDKGNKVYETLLTAEADEKGNFLLEGKLPAPDYYSWQMDNTLT